MMNNIYNNNNNNNNKDNKIAVFNDIYKGLIGKFPISGHKDPVPVKENAVFRMTIW